MSQTATFYSQQAANCGKAAADARLANEREKFRQAQVAWQTLAAAATRTNDEAVRRDAERRSRLAD